MTARLAGWLVSLYPRDWQHVMAKSLKRFFKTVPVDSRLSQRAVVGT